jgi:hypothetical protein
VAALTNAYDQALTAVSAYGVQQVDFDVEHNDGDLIAQSTALTHQAQAIAALQARHPALRVTYTLPTEPTRLHDDYAGGMMTESKAVLTKAVAAKVKIDAVNGMAMDYGDWYSDGSDMGQDAISVAATIHKTLTQLYPSRTSADLWRMVGLTPMLGRNDEPDEQFTVGDVQTMVDWGTSQPIGMVAMWSSARDRPCASGESFNSCNDIGAPAWAFGQALAGFTPAG